MRPANSPPHPRSALIIDDLTFNRILLRRLLTALDFTVEEAADGERAIQHLGQKAFDAVFLDWSLPRGPQGDDIARHIRSQPAHAHTLLVAITCDTSDAMRTRCATAGVNAFLGKTITAASVENALAAAAGHHLAASSSPNAAQNRTERMLDGYADHFPGGIREALRRCREELVIERRRVRTATSAARWTEAARAAHNLGALGAIMGRPEIRLAAQAFENALSQETMPPAPRLAALARLDAAIERTCAELAIFDSTSGSD